MTQNIRDGGRSLWRCDRVVAILLLALAAGVAWECRHLPFGSISQPGPAAWPLALAALLALLSLAVFAGATASPASRELQWGERRHAFAVIMAAAFAALALETLGFPLTMLVLLLFLIGVIERRRLLPTILVSAGIAFGTYFIFAYALKVPLPRGLLGL